MSLQNGKCTECGGVLLLDSSKEKVVCRNCGHEIIIEQALQKCVVDGIAPFETILLSAEQAIEFDQDYDKAEKKYREALNLQPNNHLALWGLFLCEIESIKWGYSQKGFIQFPGDLNESIENAINRYGNRAYENAPNDIKPYFYRTINTIKTSFIFNESPKKKKGCYIATSVYGSYNCPEVWVLRRYRDYHLDKHIMGKLFIKFYYALSPKLIKWFGKKQWFENLWKKKLDKKIVKLKKKGYKDTPYNDKY